MRWGFLLLALLGGAGCGGFRIGQASTVFAIGTGAAGIGDINNKACIFILGTSGLYRGMAMVNAQGNATLEECHKLQPTDPGTVVLPSTPQ